MITRIYAELFALLFQSKTRIQTNTLVIKITHNVISVAMM